MKHSDSTNVQQTRELSRASVTWSFGCAWLMLIALASSDAQAQTTVVDVTFQPGETAKTVEAPRAPSFTVRVHTPEYICHVRAADEIKTRIRASADSGGLQGTLSRMESFGTESSQAIAQALKVITPDIQLSGPLNRAIIVFTGMEEEGVLPPTSGTNTWTLAQNCLEVGEARAVVNEIRRIIRAYLGLPPPNTGMLAPSTTDFRAPAGPTPFR